MELAEAEMAGMVLAQFLQQMVRLTQAAAVVVQEMAEMEPTVAQEL